MDGSQFDWKSIAGVVAPFAPKLGAVLGTAVGGPLGGLIGGGIGSLAGNVIAGYLGVPADPTSVGTAIAQDPSAPDKLAQAEAEHGQEVLAQAQVQIERLKQETEQSRIQQEGDTASQGQVNESIRAELQASINGKQDSYFYSGWRPTAGHILNVLVVAFGAPMAYSMGRVAFSGDISLILNNLGNIVLFLSIPGAVVGVTAWGRSFEIGKAVRAPDAVLPPVAVAPVTPIASPPVQLPAVRIRR